MNKEILAVIPARGGSKGIRRKNLRLLGGKPLIFYQIKNALQSKYITDVIVSSEDEEILDYVSKFSVYVRKRPERLSRDDVPLDPVVYDAVNYIEKKNQKKYDIVITLQPTSPLLKRNTLDKAMELFLKEGMDTLISVVDATHLYWRKEKHKIIPEFEKRVNRQWLPKKYKEVGAFFITKREFVREDSRFGKLVSAFVLDETEGIDIDTWIDWLVAENLLKRLKILFVVNGNKNVGMGHVYRAISIADNLFNHDILFLTYDSNSQTFELIREHGYTIIDVKRSELINKISEIKPDVVINDILDTEREYISSLKNLNIFVVNFEDLGSGSDEANLVFNALYEKTNPKRTHKFGYEYVCLNEKFYLYDPIRFNEIARTLFISFGGVDQNNLTCRVLKLIPETFSHTSLNKVVVVIGPAYAHREELNKILKLLEKYKDDIEIYENVRNMPKVMSKVDIAITSNGRTVYELAAMGIPTISISQNDRETLHLFARYHKGIKYLGVACNLKDNEILDVIKDIVGNQNLRKRMYEEQIKASKTIRKGIDKIINEILSEYWRWRNEKN